MFTPRLEMPKKDNRYYIPKSEGGLNPGVARPSGSRLRFANCVFYALGRYAELWKIWLDSTNAENFCDMAKRHGLEISQSPALGAIAVWAKGKVGDGSDGAGHVAVVEIVNPTGSIVTSESGWNASKEFWTQTRKNDGNWGQSNSYKFLGFVMPPVYLKHALKEGDKGAEVELMQSRLVTKGFLRKDEVDGDFGLITLGALLCFQFKNGLEVDGICGPKTRAKLTM